MDDDRLMLLLVTRRVFLDLIQGNVVSLLRLPRDARIREVHNDFQSGGFTLVIHSGTFEPVPVGHTIPNMPPFPVQVNEERYRQRCEELGFSIAERVKD